MGCFRFSSLRMKMAGSKNILVPFKSVGRRWNGGFFEGGGGGGVGEALNSELVYTIRVNMISGRRGGGGGGGGGGDCRIFNYLPFLPQPHFKMERPLHLLG